MSQGVSVDQCSHVPTDRCAEIDNRELSVVNSHNLPGRVFPLSSPTEPPHTLES